MPSRMSGWRRIKAESAAPGPIDQLDFRRQVPFVNQMCSESNSFNRMYARLKSSRQECIRVRLILQHVRTAFSCVFALKLSRWPDPIGTSGTQRTNARWKSAQPTVREAIEFSSVVCRPADAKPSTPADRISPEGVGKKFRRKSGPWKRKIQPFSGG